MALGSCRVELALAVGTLFVVGVLGHWGWGQVCDVSTLLRVLRQRFIVANRLHEVFVDLPPVVLKIINVTRQPSEVVLFGSGANLGRGFHGFSGVVELGHLRALRSHLADVEHLALLAGRALTDLLVLGESLPREVPAADLARRHGHFAARRVGLCCGARVEVETVVLFLVIKLVCKRTHTLRRCETQSTQ